MARASPTSGSRLAAFSPPHPRRSSLRCWRAYGQSVRRRRRRATASRSARSRTCSRVVLIDRERRIRNVYSASFLHADTADRPTSRRSRSTRRARRGRGRAGRKRRRARRTATSPRCSSSRDTRRSASRRLAGAGRQPADCRPRSRSGASSSSIGVCRTTTRSPAPCATCRRRASRSNEMATAVGIEGRTVKRNAPTMLNVAYAPAALSRRARAAARAADLEPLAGRATRWAIRRSATSSKSSAALDDYRGPLRGGVRRPRADGGERRHGARELRAHPASPPTAPSIAGTSASSEDALGASAKRGYALFAGKAGCASCHVDRRPTTRSSPTTASTTPGSATAAMLDRRPRDADDRDRRRRYHRGRLRRGRRRVARFRPPISAATRSPRDPADRWRYRTPSLRNVALTAPYMHDGSLATLARSSPTTTAAASRTSCSIARIRPLRLTRRREPRPGRVSRVAHRQQRRHARRRRALRPVGDRR